MPSQMARILNDYRRTMPEAGAGLRRGTENYVAIKRQREQDAIKEAAAEKVETREAAKEGREIAKEGREIDVYERERRHEKMQEWMGPASTADTPEKWLSAQDSGFLPKELKFETREPFIMAVMTESERLAREKEGTRAGESTRTFGETVRHNKAMEAREAKGKGSGRSPGGLKASDENFISKEVSNLFDGTYDVSTGRIQIKDDTNRRKARKLITRASQLAKGNPEMTLSQAVTQAAEEGGINIRDLDKPAPVPMDQNPLGWHQ